MPDLDSLETIFVITAFLFQIILIIHFALRKWRFATAVRYGRIVYGLSIPAVIVSMLLVLSGKPWFLWTGGFLYIIWASYGYVVEYVREIEWRSPIRWPVLIPYIFLYLATVMFYWWPLARVIKPLWYVYTVLFVISTVLNVTSHKSSQVGGQSSQKEN